MSDTQTIVGMARPKATLIGEKGTLEGINVVLSGPKIIIGRDGNIVDVVLDDSVVSRSHARISWLVNEYVIEDLNSSNGTIVNGEPLMEYRSLKSGDRIYIGKNILLFQIENNEPNTLPQVAAPAQHREAPRPAPNFEPIPARIILDEATRINQQLGNENLGSLSESHGFLPIFKPEQSLPSMFKVWDDTAAALPDLWRAIKVRQTLLAMPVLAADKDALPDKYLLRASVIMSILAHAYHRISAEEPEFPMPDSVQKPWEEISQRLNRLAPHLSYIDLILYNWRLLDPDLEDDRFGLKNLELLVSTVDNQEEKVLYLMQVEAHFKIGPVTGAIVRAQEAVARQDIDALKTELIFITDGMKQFGSKVFMALNPNPYSDTFVDPVVWAKTVAPFAVPVTKGVVGPSGVSAPLFHMLDVFFGRHHYTTHLGEEMLNMRRWYPKHWREFFDALEKISVAEFVAASDDSVLSGLYKEAVQGYVGDSGFLSVHKLKAYGYLDIAFKVGRSVTIGGFSGLFKDRIWDDAVDELAFSQDERVADFPKSGHFARVKSIDAINPEGDPEKWVKRVVLDISDNGIRYQTGDRCAILPENSDALVQKTLAALHATGNESITLNANWRQAIKLRFGYQTGDETLSLGELLRFGQIRPVKRDVAKALLGISFNGKLRRIVESRAEDQWELWDILNLISQGGFDPKRLWKAHPGEREHICRIVLPEAFRMYSISSGSGDAGQGANEITLTIGRLNYETPETDVSQSNERAGTSSHFLGDTNFQTPEDCKFVSLKLVHPARFSLPEDPATPIVMFAGGTGIAPFRGFIKQRDQQENTGESWLFLAARDRQEFYYKDEFETFVAKGKLHVRPAFSRDGVDTSFVSDGQGGGGFVFEPGSKRYIGEEMLREENAKMLWNIIRSKEQGGLGGHLYVCGRTGFAVSVMDAIKEILHKFSTGSDDEKAASVNEILYRLVGEERYKQDIFTTYTGAHIAKDKAALNASDIVLHNNHQQGFWMVISGRVYDMTEFGHLHPGGFKIIHSYSGMDGTQAYEKVLHHINPEVDSMLGMYELGGVRRLDFGMEWAVVVGPDGLRFMLLADAFRAWIRYMYNVVEMENALSNDYLLKSQTIIADDSPDSSPPIKLQYLLEVHDRFMINFVTGTTGDILDNLFAVTSGFCAPDKDVRWMKSEIERINNSQEAEIVRRLSGEIQKSVNNIVDTQPEETHRSVLMVKKFCDLMALEDKRFLHEIKMISRSGVQVFETSGKNAVRDGAGRLMDAIMCFPKALENYHARVMSGALALLLDASE